MSTHEGVAEVKEALRVLDDLASHFKDSTRTISNAPASLLFELGAGEYSPVAYTDAVSFASAGAKEFADDIQSVGNLETLLKQGEEYVNLLYTFRSIRRALSMVEEKTASDQDAYYAAAFKILQAQFQKFTAMNNFVTQLRNESMEIIKRMLVKMEVKEVISEGLYERLIDIIDMMVVLDSLKDMKASLINEFSLYKRIFEKMRTKLPDAATIDEHIRFFQNFLIDPKTGAKNVIFYRFRNELHTTRPGYESIMIDLVDHCLYHLNSKKYLLCQQKHKYIRALPHLMLLIDQEIEPEPGAKKHKEQINVFKLKDFKFEEVRTVIKRNPSVPLFGDVALDLLVIVQRCPNWSPELYPKFHSATMEEAAALSPNKMPPEYDLTVKWTKMRQDYSVYLPHLVDMINDVEQINNEKRRTGKDAAPPELGGVVIQNLYTGLELISSWTGHVLEQAAWKAFHPAETKKCCMCNEDLPITYFEKREWDFDAEKEKIAKNKRGDAYVAAIGACNDCLKIKAMMERKMEQITREGRSDKSDEMLSEDASLMAAKSGKGGMKGQDYARVVRFNYSRAELDVLIDCISMIKSLAAVIKKAEHVLAGPIRQGIHMSVQNFVQNSIVDWLHRSNKSESHKRFKWVKDILLKLRESLVDWKDGMAVSADYKERKKVRADMRHSIDKREVAPSTSQLFFMRTVIRALFADNSPAIKKSKFLGNVVLTKDDVDMLKNFYDELVKFEPLLDIGSSVRKAADLSDLWYREFYLEMTKCTQFPIEMSLPWIVTEYVIKNPSSNAMENVFYALDLYNDAANRALYQLKQKFLYDEIEAEVNLVFDQLIFILCDTIYGHYKNLAASSLMDKPYFTKMQNMKGVNFLETERKRFEVVMTQRRFQLLGRTQDVSELITQRINDYFLRDLDVIIQKYESNDLMHIIELDNLLQIMRVMHETLSEHLALDPFKSMVAEVNEAVAPTTYKGRIAIHTLSEFLMDLIPNSTYNTLTRRLVRSDISYEEKVERRKMPRSMPSSFLYGSRCSRAYERAHRLRWGYFGQAHAAALVRVLGFAELPMVLEEIINNVIVSEINGGMLSQYVSVLKEGLAPTKLVGNWGFYGAHGMYGFFEAKLGPLVQYSDLKSRVFHRFRMIGNSLALAHLFEGVADFHDMIGFLHTAPYIGSTVEKVVPRMEAEGPLVTIMTAYTTGAAPALGPASKAVVAGCTFAAKRAHAMHVPSASSLLLLRPAMRKIADALKAQAAVFSPPPANGLLEVEQCNSFHRLWSSMQFLFDVPLSAVDAACHLLDDETVFGDGFAWGGIALIYLAGQMPAFEMLDFSYHVLRVSEYESSVAAAKKRTLVKKSDDPEDVAGDDLKDRAAAFVRTSKRRKTLNDMLFSIFENALPDATSKSVLVPHPPEDDAVVSSATTKIVSMSLDPTAVDPTPTKVSEYFSTAKPTSSASSASHRSAAVESSPPAAEVPAPSEYEEEEVDSYPAPPDVPLPEGAAFAIALWDYEAKDSTELSFKEDQYIIVTSQDSADWWMGRIALDEDGPVLMLPANYVEVITS